MTFTLNLLLDGQTGPSLHDFVPGNVLRYWLGPKICHDSNQSISPRKMSLLVSCSKRPCNKKHISNTILYYKMIHKT